MVPLLQNSKVRTNQYLQSEAIVNNPPKVPIKLGVTKQKPACGVKQESSVQKTLVTKCAGDAEVKIIERGTDPFMRVPNKLIIEDISEKQS